jgi:hypothetical protein
MYPGSADSRRIGAAAAAAARRVVVVVGVSSRCAASGRLDLGVPHVAQGFTALPGSLAPSQPALAARYCRCHCGQ